MARIGWSKRSLGTRERVLATLLVGVASNLALGQSEQPTAQGLHQFERRVEDVVEASLRCTVSISVGPNNGSGVVVDPSGLVLTAAHVIGKAGNRAQIRFEDGRTVMGRTLGVNSVSDAGMIEILDPGPWPAAPLAKKGSLTKGDWCVTTGHPGGYDADRGAVVRLGRVLTTEGPFVRTDCPILRGDSGGPLFNLSGEVIAIHSRLRPRLTDNFHVPVSAYQDNWDRLRQATPWPMLGINGRGVRGGCEVLSVMDGLPVQRAGLRVGDVIREFNGERVRDMDDLVSLIARHEPGDWVSLQVSRRDEALTLRTRLVERPEGDV